MRNEGSAEGEGIAAELRAFAALRHEMVPGREARARQAAFAAKQRISPAALEVALWLVPAEDATLGAFVTRLSARLPGTLRGGPVEDARWWCVVDGLVRQSVPAWAREGLAALESCGVPAAETGASRLRALIDRIGQLPTLGADARAAELDGAITEVGLALMEVEDQLDAALGATGFDFKKEAWYEAGMPNAPDPELPARAPWKPADLLVLGASSVLDDIGRVICSTAVLEEVRRAPQGGEAALRRTTNALAERMAKTLEGTLEAVLAVDGPVETPLSYSLWQALSDPAVFVGSAVLVVAIAAAAWIVWGRR